MKSNEYYINKFILSTGFSSWGYENPISKIAVIKGINEFDNRLGRIPGATNTIKNIAENSNKKAGQWWGYLSEIRCALWLTDNGISIDEFNVKTEGQHNVDISVSGVKIDVVSFGADFSDPKSFSGISDERTIERLASKINEKFDIQKADLVICDDIFSNDSNSYTLAPYFWEEAKTSRKDIFQSYFGNRLDKIAVISFTSDMIKKPTIRFIRKAFEKQLGL